MESYKDPGRRVTRHGTRTPANVRVPDECPAKVQQWIIRMALDPMSSRDFFTGRAGRDEVAVLSALSIRIPEDGKLNRQAILRKLSSRLSKLDSMPSQKHGILYHNIQRLSGLLDLLPSEQEILTFLALLHDVRALSDISKTLGPLSTRTICSVLAEVLELNPADIRNALRRDGALVSAGLVETQAMQCVLSDKLDVLTGLSDILLGDHEDPLVMFSEYFRISGSPQLTLADYPHLGEDITLLSRFLASAMTRKTCGTNILVYGTPGTGKTEFTKALSRGLSACLYEVSHEDEQGEAKMSQRFRAYLLCQRVLVKASNSLILFDEIEDVFPNNELLGGGLLRRSGRDKAWTNRLLESNPVPTFWLCNEVGQIDQAFLRRFTYSFEFRTPPQSVRLKILEKAAQGLPVTKEWTTRMAASQHLTPAQIMQACKVANLAGAEESQAVEQLMERVLNNSFKVMGRKAESHLSRHANLTHYSLEFLNPSHDLARLTESLKQKTRGRLCLYGPPGAGKTAFAHYVAEQLDKPILTKRASDILSMWLGGTEENIAKMFQEARLEEAVLLLDEADSFLQDRREAHRSWEVTQVNELLVQMENFEGLFICATNLMETLDEAVFRRFDMKIHFDYLKSGQAWRLFLKTLEAVESPLSEPRDAFEWEQQLAKLEALTPGDFSTVLRQARLLEGPYNGERLIVELQNECRAKLKGQKQISGFMG